MFTVQSIRRKDEDNARPVSETARLTVYKDKPGLLTNGRANYIAVCNVISCGARGGQRGDAHARSFQAGWLRDAAAPAAPGPRRSHVISMFPI